ncbi:hypothetical protein [Streptomyces radiopugnans]|jgi:hypothetical protein|uniref:hypothetical protein n=1 Tax=Streptomyces radiopugnans TaxID=403935 RepID=UPI003F1C0E35
MPSYSGISFALRRLAVAAILCASVAGAAAMAALSEQPGGFGVLASTTEVDWPPVSPYDGNVDWPPAPPQG